MKIAICGKMCSGKSTLAQMICQHDNRYKIYSFGKKVKEVATDLFSMDPAFKDRKLLTNLATHMREIDDNVWVNYVLSQTKDKEHCIIDDLRYQNEYDALVEDGWIFIQTNVRPHIQEMRLKLFYKNYKDHLECLEHESERNQYQWKPDHFPQLVFHDHENEEDVDLKLKEFLDNLKTPL